MKKRIIVGITGASGAPLAVALLKVLQEMEIETHLIVTRGGEMTLQQECGVNLADIRALADECYDNDNIGAAVASGSFRTTGMIVVPCSMKTVAGIHSGYCLFIVFIIHLIALLHVECQNLHSFPSPQQIPIY